MIIVRLMGGLGNQMFQYATGRSLADRTGSILKLDLFDYNYDKLRRFELSDFQIRSGIAIKEEIASLNMNTDRLSLAGRIRHRFLPARSENVFREKTMTYSREIEDINGSVYLDGYWQSERYFLRNKAAIQQDFRMIKDYDDPNREMLAKIGSVQSVSVHVRRSDYLTSRKTRKLLPVCGVDYYRNAVNYVSSKIGEAHFFVFSDDHEWAHDNLKFIKCKTFVTVNAANTGIKDMMLMKACKHHIIANSSFSWWGAWLNPSVEKIVIAPRDWFSGKLRMQTGDLIPSAWVRM